MILSKAGRVSLLAALLCLLLVCFTGASYGAIRWDVYPSPTEVINSGRSEVLGSITLVVQQGQGTVVTGNNLGGPTQIGILYNQKIQIDNGNTATLNNWTSSNGVKVWSNLMTTAFASSPIQFSVQNIDVTGTGQYAGFVTIYIPGGITMNPGDIIRLDGVRGRIDRSDLVQPGTDGYAQLQSINDPAGNQFFPETVRIAKSFLPMTVTVTSQVATLCLPSYGYATQTQNISVMENFVRAFVARDSNPGSVSPGTSVPDLTDRIDSFNQVLGTPSNGTMLRLVLNSIPPAVSGVTWPSPVAAGGPGGAFYLVSTPSFTASQAASVGQGNGSSAAVYEYLTSNQAGVSDANTETFLFQPKLVLSATNQQDIYPNAVRAGVSLWPPPRVPTSSSSDEPTSGLYAPYGTNAYPGVSGSPSMPRFVTNYLSGTFSASDPLGTTATTQFGVYETFAPCVCYLLYPYTTKDSFWDTGIVVANTSDDTGVLTTLNAPKQAGTVTFWLYDFRLGNVTPTAGVYFKDDGTQGQPIHRSPLNTTAPAFDGNSQPIYYAGQAVRTLVSQLTAGAISTTIAADGARTDFAGYVIAKANFQFCHGYAFIADKTFSNIAQGYIANMIPDPAVKSPLLGRTASDSADLTCLRAGEGINN